MTMFEDTWNKLLKSKKYREEFALWLLKRSVAFQIKTLRKKHCGSQAVLAKRASLTQGVVSRAEDQEYGNLTFNTVGRIAGGLDMAFIGKFVPFSELVKFSDELSEKDFTDIPTFEEEKTAFSASQAALRLVHPPKREFRLTSGAIDATRKIGPQSEFGKIPTPPPSTAVEAAAMAVGDE